MVVANYKGYQDIDIASGIFDFIALTECVTSHCFPSGFPKPMSSFSSAYFYLVHVNTIFLIIYLL